MLGLGDFLLFDFSPMRLNLKSMFRLGDLLVACIFTSAETLSNYSMKLLFVFPLMMVDCFRHV